MMERLDSIKVGKEVLFSGGIKGKVIKVGEEYVTVDAGNGLELTVNKLAISDVLNSKKNKKVVAK